MSWVLNGGALSIGKIPATGVVAVPGTGVAAGGYSASKAQAYPPADSQQSPASLANSTGERYCSKPPIGC